jgi:HTH-type transcriptional regulator/antitoxin HipB
MSQTLRSPRHEALRALIVEKRKKAGLTQVEVTKRLKRYQSFIATVESGQRRIDVVEFLDLADAIGFDPRGALCRRTGRSKAQVASI